MVSFIALVNTSADFDPFPGLKAEIMKREKFINILINSKSLLFVLTILY